MSPQNFNPVLFEAIVRAERAARDRKLAAWFWDGMDEDEWDRKRAAEAEIARQALGAGT